MENYIREARKFYSEKNPNNKMTQANLARLVGINRVTLSKIERGEIQPNIEIALRISQVLKTNVHTLFKLENNERRRLNYKRLKLEKTKLLEELSLDDAITIEELADFGRKIFGMN